MKKVFLFLLTVMSVLAGIVGAEAQNDTVKLDEMLIVATRASRKMPVAQTTVGKSAIADANVGNDIPFIIEMTPSTVVSSESGLGTGNTSFRIRGSDPTRINVTVDGVPLNDAESQAVFWVNMPDFASSLGSIQIQRGAGTSTNGGAAFGATVNMQTATAMPVPYAEIGTTVGSYNTFRNSISVGTGTLGSGFNFSARYSRVVSDGYIERSGAKHNSLHLSGQWNGDRTFVRLNLIHGEQNTGLSWNGVPGYAIDSLKYKYFEAGVSGYKPAGQNRRYNPMGEYRDENGNIKYYGNNIDSYRQTHYHLQAVQRFAQKLTGQATVHLTKGDGYYEEYRLNRKFSEHGLPNIDMGGTVLKKSDMIRRKAMDNYFYGLTFSLNYSNRRLQWISGGGISRHDGDHFGNVLWTRFNNGSVSGNEWYRNVGTKDDYNIYSKITGKVSDRLSLYADLQYRHISYRIKGIDSDLADIDQSHVFDFFNPKAGLFFDFDRYNSAYASISVANREPTRADFKDANKYGAAETPKAERLYDAELGYSFNSGSAAAGVNIYYMYYRDQLVSSGRLSSTGYPVMDNVPDSYRAGVELSGGVALCRSLRLEANLTLSQNKIRNFVAYTDQYDNSADWNTIEQRVEKLGTTSISFSPDITGNAMLRYTPVRDLTFTLTGKYVGKQYYDNTSSPDRCLDAYFTGNFGVSYSFEIYGLKFGLQGYVNNLFDCEYLSSAWVYRAVFADRSPDYIENGFFPQAGRTAMFKLTLKL
ncbi:MAG: TonB-dependent receptor plug domain-containing protein [Prevotellaceae bacterium]|jgi:iron complex outermembrane receptor protein|nr:TonB-dependent receptor plug domain-containing protein [Prevotellaceae bacterium]